MLKVPTGSFFRRFEPLPGIFERSLRQFVPTSKGYFSLVTSRVGAVPPIFWKFGGYRRFALPVGFDTIYGIFTAPTVDSNVPGACLWKNLKIRGLGQSPPRIWANVGKFCLNLYLRSRWSDLRAVFGI